MKKASIDWDTFLHTVRQFPHLRQIAIQSSDYLRRSPCQRLVEFLAHLGEAWFGLGELLGLHYNDGEWHEPKWVQSRLDTLMDEIKQTVWFPTLSCSSCFIDLINASLYDTPERRDKG